VAPSTYAEVMQCDKEAFNRFFHAMLERGVYLAPSAYEAGFVSARTPRGRLGAIRRLALVLITPITDSGGFSFPGLARCPACDLL